jgi:hypothetical protein
MVERMVEHRVGPTAGVITERVRMFVEKALPTDRVVEPTDAELSDLAGSMPDAKSGIGRLTFRELAEKRRVKPAERPVEAVPEPERLVAVANLAVHLFPRTRQEEAVELVESCTDDTLLQRWYEAELTSERPRPIVLAAFRRRGIGTEAEIPGE